MISVIIPAFNNAKFLGDALDSVLAQTTKVPLDIIVYDDGSTDDTREVCEGYEEVVRYIHGSVSQGANHARNRAVENSRGDYLAFLDSDDLWLPDKLTRQLSVLQGCTSPSIVFGLCQEFDENGVRGDFEPCCLTNLCFLRKDDFLKIGPFDETLRLGDFAEWLSRAQDLGYTLLKPDIRAARRRHHAQNSGRRLKEHRNDYLEVVRRRLARNRATQSSDSV